MSINLTQSENIEMKYKANIGLIFWIRGKVLIEVSSKKSVDRGREGEDWDDNMDSQVPKGLEDAVNKTRYQPLNALLKILIIILESRW